MPRILRLGLLVPVAFISLTAAVVAVALTYRSWQFEKAERQAQKQAIEAHVLVESPKIAEEVYLKLDNWAAREKQIETFFQGKGSKTKLRFEPASSDAARIGTDGSQKAMHWVYRQSAYDEERLEVPLFFSDLFVGMMFVDVSWGSAWSFGGLGNLSVSVLAPLTAIISLWILTALILRRKVFAPLLENILRFNRLEAISETTQMIAHDVRKPFHMMRLTLQALKKTAHDSGIPEVRSLADELVPTIEKVSAEVDDMLRDIGDLERPFGVNPSPASLSGMITSIAGEYEPQREEKDVALSLLFRHTHVAMIDAFKIRRVLSNLLQNAFHAVDRNGKVWINTFQKSGKHGQEIVVCIGNTGSTISADDLTRLFDRFFTKGKKNGTGLGLAIAKKFVTAHGGAIWCESIHSGTQFFFTVPAGSIVEVQNAVGPHADNSKSVAEANLNGFAICGNDRCHGGLAPTPQTCANPARVALISDDAFFLEGLKALLETLPDADFPRVDAIDSYKLADIAHKEAILSRAQFIIVDFINENCLRAVIGPLRRLSKLTKVCVHGRDFDASTANLLDPSFDRIATPIDSTQLEKVLSQSSRRRLSP